MTISKFCRLSKINIIDISKRTGITLVELNIMYQESPYLIEQLAKKWDAIKNYVRAVRLIVVS